MKDYYEILGVSKDASTDEIKKRFRQLARETHPDANPGDPEAEHRFREIAEAYEVLSDRDKRAAYDRGDQFDAANLFSSFAGIEDLLNSFFGSGFGGLGDFGAFGGRQTARARGADALVEVEITLEEAASGIQREVSFPTAADCVVCTGSGADPEHAPKTCDRCGGAGAVRATRRTMLGAMTTLAACDVCAGAGKIIEHPCTECRGRGTVDETRTVTVEIPQGIMDQSRLRLGGRGGSVGAAGPPGDLYVSVHVRPDERFRRNGDDLIHTLRLGMAEAALGKTLDVPLLDGESTEVEIPAGTQPGTVFQLPRKGMPRLQRRGRGDLLINVEVEVPTSLTADQADALRRYAELSGEDPAAEKRRKRRRG